MPHSTFSDRVYWLVAQIPPGYVTTYGQIATLAGSAGAARAVGTLMRNCKINTTAEIPWQRVINAQGAIPSKGDIVRAELQRYLLEKEGIQFSSAGTCSLDEYGWTPEWIPWE